jgi:protein-S-isoprenylcysteine O-methyltransferase Ste14
MTKFTPREWMSRLRVRAGLIAAIVVLILARPTWTSISVGMIISLAGLAIRAWASGHLRKEKALAVSGPYRFSRNPLYLGNFIMGIGIVVGARSWWVLGLFVVYFAVFYPVIIRREKDRMKALFPEQYEEYKRRVPSFFPSLLRHRVSSGEKFSWALYSQNKEFRALAGMAAFWIAMAVRILLLNR